MAQVLVVTALSPVEYINSLKVHCGCGILSYDGVRDKIATGSPFRTGKAPTEDGDPGLIFLHKQDLTSVNPDNLDVVMVLVTPPPAGATTDVIEAHYKHFEDEWRQTLGKTYDEVPFVVVNINCSTLYVRSELTDSVRKRRGL